MSSEQEVAMNAEKTKNPSNALPDDMVEAIGALREVSGAPDDIYALGVVQHAVNALQGVVQQQEELAEELAEAPIKGLGDMAQLQERHEQLAAENLVLRKRVERLEAAARRAPVPLDGVQPIGAGQRRAAAREGCADCPIGTGCDRAAVCHEVVRKMTGRPSGTPATSRRLDRLADAVLGAAVRLLSR